MITGFLTELNHRSKGLHKFPFGSKIMILDTSSKHKNAMFWFHESYHTKLIKPGPVY